MSAAKVASDASSRFMFFSAGVLGVVVLAAGLWASAQYGGNYKEVGADGKGGFSLDRFMSATIEQARVTHLLGK